MVAHAWNIPKRDLTVVGLGCDGNLVVTRKPTRREAVEAKERDIVIEEIIELAERITFFNKLSRDDCFDYISLRKMMLSLGELSSSETWRLHNEFRLLATRFHCSEKE